jgi:hypothetical protein
MATARLSQATARGVSDSLSIMGKQMHVSAAAVLYWRSNHGPHHPCSQLVLGFAGPARKAREPAAGEVKLDVHLHASVADTPISDAA